MVDDHRPGRVRNAEISYRGDNSIFDTDRTILEIEIARIVIDGLGRPIEAQHPAA
ncbi:hypothetical protein D3C71_1973380 [compost metagenome]